MILVDAHVHIYDCFGLERFLDAAYSNFQSIANRFGYGNEFVPILLLTETAKDFWFDRLRQYANINSTKKDNTLKRWEFHQTAESVSLTARKENSKDLIIVSGRQIETSERLEVLVLSTVRKVNFGIPIMNLIREAKKEDAIYVIPWGFGKWWGKRGEILNNLIETHKDLKIFLGDNSGRPSFLPSPNHFEIAMRNGIHILPGSDPLPFATEYNRAGRFGFLLEGTISEKFPAENLKQFLMKSELKIQSYGVLEHPFRFFRNQFKMQIKKQRIKRKA